MKTLRESLFDDDLVTKKMETFGDIFEPFYIRVAYNNRPGVTAKDGYNVVASSFDYEKLKHDIKPDDELNAFIKWSSMEYANELQYILALINDIPLSKSDADRWSRYSEVLKDEISRVLDKYKKRGEWSRKHGYVTMTSDRDCLPYLLIGNRNMYNASIEIYFKRKG